MMMSFKRRRYSRQEVLSKPWSWIVCLGFQKANGEYQVEFVGRILESRSKHHHQQLQHELSNTYSDLQTTGHQNTRYQNSQFENKIFNIFEESIFEESIFEEGSGVSEFTLNSALQNSVLQDSTQSRFDLLDILEEFKTCRDVFHCEEYCLNRLQLFFELISLYPPTLENMRRIYSIFPDKTELSLCVSKIPQHEKIFPFTIIVANRFDQVYNWLHRTLFSPLDIATFQDYRKITIFTDCIILENPDLFYQEHQMLPLHIPRVLILSSLDQITVQQHTKVYKFKDLEH